MHINLKKINSTQNSLFTSLNNLIYICIQTVLVKVNKKKIDKLVTKNVKINKFVVIAIYIRKKKK